MLLNRFLHYFAGVSPNNPKETKIEFRRADLDDTANPLSVQKVTFNVDENKWVVELY